MKIGIIVEGQSEFHSLPGILRSLGSTYQNTVLRPVLAAIPPMAGYGVMARACKSRLGILENKKVDRILVLVDREDRSECPGAVAVGLAAAIQPLTAIEVQVVVKDRCYENWLVADLDALKAQPQRFSLSNKVEKSVVPNKADSVDALKLLKTACSGHYDKVEDSKRIASHATVARIGANSRSFRRFLRCINHQKYQKQSRKP